MSIKLKEISSWVANHKHLQRVLKNWSRTEITKAIYDASLCNGLIVFKRNHTIEGIIVAFPNPTTKIFWITAIIADSKEALKYFVRVFNQLYPDYQLAGHRHNLDKIFKNTPNFVNRLHQLS